MATAKQIVSPPEFIHQTPISESLAAFTASLAWDDIPSAVIERAKLHILDALGIGLAASRYDYSHKTLTAMRGLAGEGPYPVIGMPARLPLRDAAQMNGFLVHALDFDDTHVAGVIHATCTAVPTLLALGQRHEISGREMLIAYLTAIETDARIGMAAKGGFHRKGFHPTGVVGAYGAALAAGRASGLTQAQLRDAQGIALGMCSGTLGFLDEGAWNKRLHAGWASVVGITAAALAGQGFQGPSKPYEGKFGLYDCFTEAGEVIDWAACTHDLGSDWEMLRIGIKPYPACHLVHSTADAMAALKQAHGLEPGNVASIRARVAKDCMSLVCDPIDKKRRPGSGYDAQFSIPYAVASVLARGRLTLAELEPEVFTDPEILAQCDKVSCEPDPESAYPKYFSGEVVVTTTDGRELVHREQINRGADERPLSGEEIIAKFRANAEMTFAPDRVDAVLHAIMDLDGAATPGQVAELLAPA
jgi:2-methylcitrate dehydratase PrpD